MGYLVTFVLTRRDPESNIPFVRWMIIMMILSDLGAIMVILGNFGVLTATELSW